MKTPISYYGGKQNLLPYLLPLIPEHHLYVEPFCGGAALFWAKQRSKNEVLNDVDGLLINFWTELQNNYEELTRLIHNTLHAEQAHTEAKQIIKSNSPTQRAWAYWVLTQMSFSYKFNSGFAFSKDNREPKATDSKRNLYLQEKYRERLKFVTIFNRSALDLIERMDTPETFFYLDPPYLSSNCGAYEGTKDVYLELLEMLPKIQGKFMLSSYPETRLKELTQEHQWYAEYIQQNLSVSHKTGKDIKTEVIVCNYKKTQLALF